MSKLSIIIPVYYNEDTLESLHADLSSNVLPYLQDYEIVFIDDGSGDNSWAIIQKIAAQNDKILTIKLSRNFGSHSAILAGLLNCTGDCAVTKAADLQEDSALILEMYQSYLEGNTVVLAERIDREESIRQKFFANTYYFLVRKFALQSMPKHGFDCFLIDRRVIEVLRLLDEPNSSIMLQVLWSGFQTSTVQYVRRAREAGKSRWTFAKKFNLVLDSLMGFSLTPIRFTSMIGLGSFVLSIVLAAWFIAGHFLFEVSVQGWTTIMIFLVFQFGVVMLTLGILGEYIIQLLSAARSRPSYIVDELHKGDGEQS